MSLKEIEERPLQWGMEKPSTREPWDSCESPHTPWKEQDIPQ